MLCNISILQHTIVCRRIANFIARLKGSSLSYCKGIRNL